MNNNIKFLIISIIVVILFVISFLLIKNKINNSKLEEREPLFKDYKVNEYIPTYISDNDMARIYLVQYVNKMLDNRKEAYDLLDDDYRSVRFPTYESFNDYVSTLDLYNIEIDKFYKKYVGNYLVFGVFDKNENFYAFKTRGVMQYSVYLDDYTVEIR